MSEFKRNKLKSRRLPIWLQIQIWAGSIIYRGRNELGQNGQTLRLPRNRMLKLDCLRNELEAMEFVRSRTSIPIPRVLKVYEFEDSHHLVMKMIAGGPGDGEEMDSNQLRNFGAELAGYIQQLRSLKPLTQGVIGSVNLGQNHDSRLDGSAWGPFDSVAQFHNYLRLGRPLMHWEDEPDVMLVHSRPVQYSIKFTHADLRPFNILVKDGHITGIIDWEFAGWYPEYWEYTKMHWVARPFWDKFYQAIEQEAGIAKYPEELAAEVAIWTRMYFRVRWSSLDRRR